MSISILALGFPKIILNILSLTNLIEIQQETSQHPLMNKIRLASIGSIVVALIFISGSQNLIWGFLGILIGILITKQSYTIYTWMGDQFEVGPFKGDSLIKICGVVLVIASAFYMSGITQSLLRNFFQTLTGN